MQIITRMLELPWDDSLCIKNQITAFIRPYTKDWNNPESDSLHLEYSYNGEDWYPLNGNNGIYFPTKGSAQMQSPKIYELDNQTYYIVALDALNPEYVFTLLSDDLIHYSKEGYRKKADLPEINVSVTPDAKNRLPISLDRLKILQKIWGKPEPVRLSKREQIEIIESIGCTPTLPKEILVEYSNGMSEHRHVDWDDIPSSLFSAPGTYTVSGTIKETYFEQPFIYHRADPYVYKHMDNMYYFVASHTDMDHNLDGKYQYLYIILRRSKTINQLSDSSDLYEEKIIYERTPIANGTLSPHIWAPEIHYINDKWYIYYTTTISDDSPWRIRPHCLECNSSDPFTGDWINRGSIISTVENDIAFTDFSLDHTYFEHNGQHYFLWAQKTDNISDIFIARLENPWTICTPSVRLTHPEYNWELHGFAVNEGPGIIKHGDKIFLTFSCSGTDAMYCVGLMYCNQNSDLLNADSWTKCPHPVFQSSKSTHLYGLGHNSFTRSDDDTEDLIVYHGRSEARYLGEEDYQPLYDAGRNTFISKIYWEPDGMPNFSVPGAHIVKDNSLLKVSARITIK